MDHSWVCPCVPLLVVRNALTHNPQNLHTLITVISTHLFSLVTSDRPQFPDPTCTRQALNCIRVLGRIIAVLFEQASSSSSQHANAADVLWEPLGTDSSEATLADRLFGCTIDLMFCAGFTLPEQVLGEEGEKVNVSVGSHQRLRKTIRCSQDMLHNRENTCR